jgi:hypothetical protein
MIYTSVYKTTSAVLTIISGFKIGDSEFSGISLSSAPQIANSLATALLACLLDTRVGNDFLERLRHLCIFRFSVWSEFEVNLAELAVTIWNFCVLLHISWLNVIPYFEAFFGLKY